MALATHVSAGYRRVTRYSDKSTANQPLVLTIPASAARHLSWVLVKYSAAPTQAGVTIAVDSGAGSDYDGTLVTGDANAQVTSYIPSPSLTFCDDDAIVITAPAGGGGITSTIAAVMEDA